MLLRNLRAVTVGLVVATAVVLALFSLRWPLAHDLSVMMYGGFLVTDCGMVPYVDFFEMNAPGSILFYAFVHLLTDGDELLIRLVDLSILALLGGAVAVTLRRFGGWSRTMAAACFVLACLGGGPTQAMQRETLCVALLALSTALVFGRRSGGTKEWIYLLVGLCAGLATSIKPPSLIFWLPLFLGCVDAWRYPDRALPGTWQLRLVKAGAWFGLGLLLPLLAMAVWLSSQGALPAYLDLVQNYYPLYVQLGGDGAAYGDSAGALLERWLIKPLEAMASGGLAILAFLGVLAGWSTRSRSDRLFALVAVALFVAMASYLPLSGKFWYYHRIPMLFAMSICAGMAVTPLLPRRAAVCQALLVLVATLASLPLSDLQVETRLWKSGQLHEANRGYVDLASGILRARAKPDDSILILDVIGGAALTMYELRRPLYGRFLYDLHFYHHVDDPVIVDLRRQMMATLEEDPPDFVLRFSSWRPHGEGCSPTFPELEAFLDDYIVLQGAGGTALLQRPPSAGDQPR